MTSPVMPASGAVRSAELPSTDADEADAVAGADSHARAARGRRAVAGAALRRKLAQFDADDVVVTRVLAAAADFRGLPAPALDSRNRCLIPGHSGEAALVRRRNGFIRHICTDCPSDGYLALGPIDIYASARAGRLLRLKTPSLVRWRVHALHSIGHTRLEPWEMPTLPRRAPASARRVWSGIGLLLAVDALIGDAEPSYFPYSCSWAAAWSALPRTTAYEGRQWLKDNGFLRVHHLDHNSRRPTPYFVLARPASRAFADHASREQVRS
jgi:hypothetical protein